MRSKEWLIEIEVDAVLDESQCMTTRSTGRVKLRCVSSPSAGGPFNVNVRLAQLLLSLP